MTQDGRMTVTRRNLFRLLKEHGPSTADQLAQRLGLSKMGTLKHLHSATSEGLVDVSEQASGRGRPEKIWKLTEAANRIFPDAHAELSVSLISQIRSAFGDKGVKKLLQTRTREQVDGYQESLASTSTLKQRVEKLADIRTQEGYMAVVEEDGSDLLLIERHCAICSAAQNCLGLCTSELEVFSALFPENTVERVEHLMAGDTRCAYRISYQ
ncbi:MAG: helix-turn-helix transcriptional regulator [Opitutales bacterium]